MKYRIVWLTFGILLTTANCSSGTGKRAMVVGKLQKAGELATMEIKLTKFVTAQKKRAVLFIIPLADADFIAQTEAFVKTGIDLNQLEYEDIKVRDKSISLVLPPVKVLTFSYPAENFKVITKTNYFIQNITIEEIDDFYRQAELEIRERICYLGIEEDCRQKTAALMRGLLRQMGFKEIYIKFKPSEEKLFRNLHDTTAK